jgi:hypothetical protein
MNTKINTIKTIKKIDTESLNIVIELFRDLFKDFTLDEKKNPAFVAFQRTKDAKSLGKTNIERFNKYLENKGLNKQIQIIKEEWIFVNGVEKTLNEVAQLVVSEKEKSSHKFWTSFSSEHGEQSSDLNKSSDFKILPLLRTLVSLGYGVERKKKKSYQIVNV